MMICPGTCGYLLFLFINHIFDSTKPRKRGGFGNFPFGEKREMGKKEREKKDKIFFLNSKFTKWHGALCCDTKLCGNFSFLHLSHLSFLSLFPIPGPSSPPLPCIRRHPSLDNDSLFFLSFLPLLSLRAACFWSNVVTVYLWS